MAAGLISADLLLPETSEAERFWKKIEKQPNGCWVWTAFQHENIGRFKKTGYNGYVHAEVWAYENLVGPVPLDRKLKRQCETPLCVRPEHQALTPTKRSRREPTPEQRKAASIRAHRWNKEHPDALRARGYFYRLKYRFNLTAEQYDAMLAAQGGVCAACKRPESKTHNGTTYRLAIDHDHKTGVIRGLLCGFCNRALGLLRDDPEIIAGLHQYITRGA